MGLRETRAYRVPLFLKSTQLVTEGLRLPRPGQACALHGTTSLPPTPRSQQGPQRPSGLEVQEGGFPFPSPQVLDPPESTVPRGREGCGAGTKRWVSLRVPDLTACPPSA